MSDENDKKKQEINLIKSSPESPSDKINIYEDLFSDNSSTDSDFLERYEGLLDDGSIDTATKLAETHIKLKTLERERKAEEFERWCRIQEIEESKLARIDENKLALQELRMTESQNLLEHNLAVIESNNNIGYKRDVLKNQIKSEDRLWIFTIFCLMLGVLLLISGFPVEGGILIGGSVAIHGGTALFKKSNNKDKE